MDDEIHFAEVQFYFLDRSEDDPDVQAFAVISVYGPPNEEMLRESSHTLYACKYQGDTNLRCVPVSTILSVVSMQPLPRLPGDPENLWFVVEKSGQEDVQLFGNEGDL